MSSGIVRHCGSIIFIIAKVVEKAADLWLNAPQKSRRQRMGKRSKKAREEAPTPPEELTQEDKRFAGTLNHLARGIILGGSLAVIAGWLIPGAEMGRMLFLGLLVGCLAGVTMKNINDRKKRQ
jgi:predicted lipid-binding transport protein (Tim44 family)